MLRGSFLEGKTALITGGAKGIGKQITKTLAQYGAAVAINYSGSEDAAKQLADEINQNGGKAIIYKCNVADFEAVKEMMEAVIKEFGHLDILVNNAGVTKDNLMLRMGEEDFDKVIDVNLKGCFNCMKHVTRTMLKQKYGKIINISSVVGVHGNAGQVNYSASKAGIIGMTKSMAKELGVKGITVNAIAPGFIETDMTDVLSEDVKNAIKAGIPMGKMGNVEDIAQTAAFLASDAASYITGQVIGVDGGMGM